MKNERQRWIYVGGAVLLLLVLLFFLISIILNVFRQTVEPIFTPLKQANQQLTKISEVLNPTATIIPDPITIIHDIRALSRLETIQYSVEKVITAETGQGELAFLFGDRLLFVAHGVVIAGVDLANLEEDDIWIDGEKLFLRIPKAEVFIATIDNEKSYVYDRETGLFTHGDVNLETKARQVAEDEIMKAAIEDGMLDLATKNAENYLTGLFHGMGYKEVIFSYEKQGLE